MIILSSFIAYTSLLFLHGCGWWRSSFYANESHTYDIHSMFATFVATQVAIAWFDVPINELIAALEVHFGASLLVGQTPTWSGISTYNIPTTAGSAKGPWTSCLQFAELASISAFLFVCLLHYIAGCRKKILFIWSKKWYEHSKNIHGGRPWWRKTIMTLATVMRPFPHHSRHSWTVRERNTTSLGPWQVVASPPHQV